MFLAKVQFILLILVTTITNTLINIPALVFWIFYLIGFLSEPTTLQKDYEIVIVSLNLCGYIILIISYINLHMTTAKITFGFLLFSSILIFAGFLFEFIIVQHYTYEAAMSIMTLLTVAESFYSDITSKYLKHISILEIQEENKKEQKSARFMYYLIKINLQAKQQFTLFSLTLVMNIFMLLLFIPGLVLFSVSVAFMNRFIPLEEQTWELQFFLVFNLIGYQVLSAAQLINICYFKSKFRSPRTSIFGRIATMLGMICSTLGIGAYMFDVGLSRTQFFVTGFWIMSMIVALQAIIQNLIIFN